MFSGEEIFPDPQKVEVVRDFPCLQDVRDLRSFLSLSLYYRRFVANFSVVANPLFTLTKKEVISNGHLHVRVASKS